MRVLVLVGILIGLSAPCQAQTQSQLETRYVAACQKEDTEAFCRCEFKAMASLVKDPKDLEYLTDIEERTAGLSDEETDKIMKSLPPEKIQWIVSLLQNIAAAQEQCPDFRKR